MGFKIALMIVKKMTVLVHLCVVLIQSASHRDKLHSNSKEKTYIHSCQTACIINTGTLVEHLNVVTPSTQSRTSVILCLLFLHLSG